MGFDTYPALAIRQPDLGKALITAAYLKSSKLKNQLMTGKLKKQKTLAELGSLAMGTGGGPAGGAVGGAPGDQLAGAAGIPEGGSPGMIPAASPAMRALVAADPEVGGQYVTAIKNMNEETRKQKKEQNAKITRLLIAVEDAPEGLQRQQAYAQAREKARQMGIDIRNVPEQYDPRYVHQKIKFGMAIDDEIGAVEREAAKTGIWVQDPKGRRFQRFDKMKEGQVVPLAPKTYKADPGTALQRNVPFIAKTLNISSEKAMTMALQSRAMGPEATKRALYVAALRNLADPGMAQEAAEAGMLYLFPDPNAPATKPKEEPEPGFLDKAFQGMVDFVTGLGSAAPTAAAPGPELSAPGAVTPGQPPQEAIDYLLNNPTKAEDFDAKYGAGAAARFLNR